jgi:hypothetical protein
MRFGLSRAIIVSEFIDGSKACRRQPRFGRVIVSHREKPFPQFGDRHPKDLIRTCPIRGWTLAYGDMPDGGMENAVKGLPLQGMDTNKEQHAVRICNLGDSVLKDRFARAGRHSFIPLVDLGPEFGMCSHRARQTAGNSPSIHFAGPASERTPAYEFEKHVHC